MGKGKKHRHSANFKLEKKDTVLWSLENATTCVSVDYTFTPDEVLNQLRNAIKQFSED